MPVGSSFGCNHHKIREFSILNEVRKDRSSIQTLGQQPRELRKLADVLARLLSVIFGTSWRSGKVHGDWKEIKAWRSDQGTTGLSLPHSLEKSCNCLTRSKLCLITLLWYNNLAKTSEITLCSCRDFGASCFYMQSLMCTWTILWIR